MNQKQPKNLATQFQQAQMKGAIRAKYEHGEITREEYEKLMEEHGFVAEKENE